MTSSMFLIIMMTKAVDGGVEFINKVINAFRTTDTGSGKHYGEKCSLYFYRTRK